MQENSVFIFKKETTRNLTRGLKWKALYRKMNDGESLRGNYIVQGEKTLKMSFKCKIDYIWRRHDEDLNEEMK